MVRFGASLNILKANDPLSIKAQKSKDVSILRVFRLFYDKMAFILTQNCHLVSILSLVSNLQIAYQVYRDDN